MKVMKSYICQKVISLQLSNLFTESTISSGLTEKASRKERFPVLFRLCSRRFQLIGLDRLALTSGCRLRNPRTQLGLGGLAGRLPVESSEGDRRWRRT